MSKTKTHNGVKYVKVKSSRDYTDREPKLVIETMAPIVAEMDRNYLRIQILQERGNKV